MAERVITIKIKVDDKDVDKTVASVRRLESAAKSSADGGVSVLKNAISSMTGNLAADIVQNFSRYLIEAAKASYQLATSVADMAKQLDNAKARTGLSLETLAALKHEVEAAGGSFDQMQSIIAQFQKKIGDAADGSKRATADLKRLGVEPAKAVNDLDGAFREALKTINKLPPGVARTNAAIAAFGQEGAKILPVLDNFNGDVDEAVKRAKDLGLILGQDAVNASREFEKAQRELQDRLTGVKNVLGTELMPLFRDYAAETSDWFARNKGEVRSWATEIVEAVRRAVASIKQFAYEIKYVSDYLNPDKTAADVQRTATELQRLKNIAGGTSISGTLRNDGETVLFPGTGIGDGRRYATSRPEDFFRGAGGGRGGGGGGAAKLTPIQEMEKRLREGQAAFDLLSGSAYAQQLTVETAKINEQKSKLEELLKLRDRLEVNKGFAIPKTLEGLNAEIEAIRDNEKGLETAKDMLKQFQDELAGIGDQKTALEKIDALLADPKRNALITEETAAQARLTAARVDAERAAKAYTAVLQEINDMAYSEQSGLGVNIEALQKEISLGRDLTETERRRIEMKQELIDLEIKGQKAGLTAAAIDDAKKELAFHQAITLEMYKQLEALQKKREVQAAAQAMQESLEDEIMMLSRGGRELTRYERLLQAIARGTTTWEEATQKNLVVLAQQADALEELNRKHAELKAFFADNLRYVFEGDFEGLFENLRRNVIDRFTDKLSDWFATSILGFDPDSNAPIVGPVVDKLGDTNKILERIAAAVGVKPGMSLPGIPNVFGGGFGGGMSGGGNTPPFNPGYFGGGGSGGWRSIFGDRTGSITQLPNGEDAITTDGRSMWEKLTGKGGPLSVFGPRENVLTGQTSKLGGILGGAGDIASMIGGMIGGRVGGIISAIGAGASMGAMFGPWGAAIGAGIGAIFGFLQGDPKRKEDKNVNIPNLNKGFTEAFKRLNDVLTGVRQMTIDPDEAISRANEIRGEIAGGFGIEFKSKKYRKEAQKMIQAKLGQADSIIDQIKAAAEISRGAADRSKRILPEFAGGSYFADYFRPNGLLPGSFDGADNILAMISRGEMVINPMQQNRVRALAGFDVFAGAGIPNYPRASSTAKLAAGGIAGAGLSPASAPVVNVQPVIHLEGVTFNEGAKAWIEGDNGKRTLVSVIADLRQKRKI